MQLRIRDLLACISALILSQLLYKNYDNGYGSASLSITSIDLDLAFYTDYAATAAVHVTATTTTKDEIEVAVARPVPFDLDGDGIVEGLVVPSPIHYDNDNNNNDHDSDRNKGKGKEEWTLKVLDLKPLHPSASSNDGHVPIYPDVIFHSPRQVQVKPRDKTLKSTSTSTGTGTGTGTASTSTAIVPIKIKTGNILLRKHHQDIKFNNHHHDQVKIGHNGKINPIEQIKHEKRFYFCGKHWDDVTNTTKCQNKELVHCPSGHHDDCPNGEQCFANTPCDALGLSNGKNTNEAKAEAETEAARLVKTPNGGLPSIVTVWSNGDISLHSVTTDDNDSSSKSTSKSTSYEGEGKDNSKDKSKGQGQRVKSDRPELELRELWRKKLISIPNVYENVDADVIRFEEIDLILDTRASIGMYGAVIVAARYYKYTSKEEGNIPKNASTATSTEGGGKILLTSFYAIDAFKGDIIWAHTGDIGSGSDRNGDIPRSSRNNETEPKPNNENKNEPPKKISSSARRRSRAFISNEREIMASVGSNSNNNSNSYDDCLHHFRPWILSPSNGALPHFYFDSSDALLILGHFDRKSNSNKSNKINTSKVNVNSTPHEHERPNVILFHNRDGINVISLRNGNPVCHMSLMPNSVYADVNNDGIIDQLQVLSDDTNVNMGATNAADANVKTNVNSNVNANINARNHTFNENDGAEEQVQVHNFCHATLTSGITTRDRLFRINLCQGLMKALNRRRGNDSLDMLKELGTSFARPLLVRRYDFESNQRNERNKRKKSNNRNYNDRIPAYDVIFALNHGSVQRISTNGIIEWSRNGPHGDIPTWHGETGESTVSSGFLGQIDFDWLSSQRARPIVLQGDDRISILSAGEGKILATTELPRLAVGEPILADINGDGTTDILVITKNAVLGYCVEVSVGSFLSRFVVSSILLGLGVALLFHEFGQERGRSNRATD